MMTAESFCDSAVLYLSFDDREHATNSEREWT